MNYFKSTFPIFSPSREAICSQWRSGWISFSIKVCKEIWSCTDEPNKPRLFLEFTLIPGSFRFSKKLGYGNMSRDIQTCNERLDWTGLDWTRNFLVWISFLVELHFIKNLSLINSDIISKLLFLWLLLFFFKDQFYQSEWGFIRRIYLWQDEKSNSFRANCNCNRALRGNIGWPRTPLIILTGLPFLSWVACAVVNLETFSKIQRVAFELNREIFLWNLTLNHNITLVITQCNNKDWYSKKLQTACSNLLLYMSS